MWDDIQFWLAKSMAETIQLLAVILLIVGFYCVMRVVGWIMERPSRKTKR